MSENLVLLYANRGYITHVKSLIGSLRSHGQWEEDICVMSPDLDSKDFYAPRCFVKEITGEHIFQDKFKMFDDFFKKYSKVLYLDCDTMCVSPIKKIFSRASGESFCMHAEEDRNNLQSFSLGEYFPDASPHAMAKLVDSIGAEALTQKTFCTGVMAFDPSKLGGVCANIRQAALEICAQYKDLIPPTDRGIVWTDQQPLNLIFRDQWKDLNNLVCYWGLYLNNLIDLEKISILHFQRWDNPWDNDHFCTAFERTLKEQYFLNLNYYHELER